MRPPKGFAILCIVVGIVFMILANSGSRAFATAGVAFLVLGAVQLARQWWMARR